MNLRSFGRGALWVAIALQITLLADILHAAPRTVISLAGDWLFQTNGASSNVWETVRLPADFQSHEGNEFHGVGWYRRAMPTQHVPARSRMLLQFEAAATEAEVFCNGQSLGSHLGGWTPFRFDVTEFVRPAGASGPAEVRVRLDEKVGHNTQGFLPIIQPHYGGLWQDVKLLMVPEIYLDDLELLAVGNPQSGRLELRVPLRGAAPERMAGLIVRHRLRGSGRWTTTRLALEDSAAAGGTNLPPSLRCEGNDLLAEIPVASPKLWSPAEPNLYEIEIALPPNADGREGDVVRTRAAFHTITVAGKKLRLNGQPLNVRSVLNWGYYPPRLSPLPSEDRFRHDLEMARARGFNLMKFCLWLPPQRFLEMCDETGMLAWMEYPTWHPQFTPAHLDELSGEFREFFAYDRNHPSVILRSLTCETGPSADLGVVRALYDLGHAMIPGALIEDDSSWIQWNRVADFFDDHPYGNNHTWVRTLAGLRDYVQAHGPKPLVLGEAIAADTWVPRPPYKKIAQQSPRPYWFPGAFDEQEKWQNRLRPAGGLQFVEADSLHYAMLMRKYQAETFRREIPDGGYVISVIRDFATASMGLLDYRGQPKWPASDWAWQRDMTCLLQTKNDRRSFFAGEPLDAQILVSHFGAKAIANGRLSWRLVDAAHPKKVFAHDEAPAFRAAPGTLTPAFNLDSAAPDVSAPQHCTLKCELRAGRETFRNEWPLWIVPKHSREHAPQIFLHPSLSADVARELFPDATPMTKDSLAGVIVASRFDDALVNALNAGARVLMLPDGKPGSLALKEHWFLRGAPVVTEHTLTRKVPRDLLVELQAFDLAGPVVPDLDWLENLDPILLLWDTHDLRTVKTHGLIFETRVGRGRLLVSAVNHRGVGNAAGQWLLAALVRLLAEEPAPVHQLTDTQWARVQTQMRTGTVSLSTK